MRSNSVCLEKPRPNILEGWEPMTPQEILEDAGRLFSSKIRREKFQHEQPVECCYCGCQFDNIKTPTVDHISPVIRGGENSKANLEWSCYKCNLKKGSKLLHEMKFYREDTIKGILVYFIRMNSRLPSVNEFQSQITGDAIPKGRILLGEILRRHGKRSLKKHKKYIRQRERLHAGEFIEYNSNGGRTSKNRSIK